MLKITGIEVTQSIQYFGASHHLDDPTEWRPDNSVELVAGKSAIVRVYVEFEGDSDFHFVVGAATVSNPLQNPVPNPVLLNATTWLIVQGGPPSPYRDVRRNPGKTLNFPIPADRMEGRVAFVCTATSGIYRATRAFVVDIVLRQSLMVCAVPVGYGGDGPAPKTGALEPPTAQQIVEQFRWAVRTMPIAANPLVFVTKPITWNRPMDQGPTKKDNIYEQRKLCNKVAEIREADGFPSWVAYGAFLANGYPSEGQNGGVAFEENSTFQVWTDVGGERGLVHEIAHLAGRRHVSIPGVVDDPPLDPHPAYRPYPKGSIGEFGTDVATGVVYDPNTHHDHMAKTTINLWTSIFSHEHWLRHPMLAPFSDRPRPDQSWPREWPGPNPLFNARVLVVRGDLSDDGRVEVHSVRRIRAEDRPAAPGTTGLRVSLVTAGGIELAGAPIELESHGHETSGSAGYAQPEFPTSAAFRANLADVAEGAALVVHAKGRVLWRRDAPRRPLRVEAPRTKCIRRRSEIDVRWRVNRRKVESAWVRVSTDGGANWRMIGLAQNERSMRISARLVPAGPVLMQVVVHDGFFSTESEAVPFRNETYSPEPVILWPHAGFVPIEHDMLCLWGNAVAQPGSEPPAVFRWYVDGALMGEGAQLYATAPGAGEHRCELRLLDKRGVQLSTTTVRFYTQPRTFRHWTVIDSRARAR